MTCSQARRWPGQILPPPLFIRCQLFPTRITTPQNVITTHTERGYIIQHLYSYSTECIWAPTALTRFEGTFLAVSSECMEKENKEEEEYKIWHSFVPSLGDQGGTGSHPGGTRSSWGRYHFWFLSQAQASTFFSAIFPQERLVGTERGEG